MEALFLKLLRMSLSASVLVLAVLVLRLVLRRAPKWTHVLLWALVALRLLCPFTVESSLSLQPQRTDELAQSIAGYAEFDARSAVGQHGAVPEAPLASSALAKRKLSVGITVSPSTDSCSGESCFRYSTSRRMRCSRYCSE